MKLLKITKEQYDYAIDDTRHLRKLKQYQIDIGYTRELLECFKLENEYVKILAEKELTGLNFTFIYRYL